MGLVFVIRIEENFGRYVRCVGLAACGSLRCSKKSFGGLFFESEGCFVVEFGYHSDIYFTKDVVGRLLWYQREEANDKEVIYVAGVTKMSP